MRKKNIRKVEEILREHLDSLVFTTFKSVRSRYSEDRELPKGFLKDWLFKKQKEVIENVIKKNNIEGSNIYFNLSLAGYGKTTEIVKRFNLGRDTIVVSFLNTTIDRVLEKYKEENRELFEEISSNKDYLTKSESPAKTIHSVAYRVLANEGYIKLGHPVLDFESAFKKKIRLLTDVGKLNKGDIDLFLLFKYFTGQFSYSSDSWLDLPLLTLTFDYYILYIIQEFRNEFVMSVIRLASQNEELFEDILNQDFLITVHCLKKFFEVYYEILEPLYFDAGDFLNFTSLLGISFRQNLRLLDRENLKAVFPLRDYKNVNIIVDEAQDLNPLMTYLILNSYEKEFRYYFYGDPFQAINSFQGSSIKFFLTLPDLLKTDNFIFSNKTYRLNEVLSSLINIKILPSIKRLLANFNLQNKIPFKEIKSMKNTNAQETKELFKVNEKISELKKKFDGCLPLKSIVDILKDSKIAILTKTNSQTLQFLEDSFRNGFVLNTTQRDVLDSKIKLRDLRKKILSNKKLKDYDKNKRLKYLFRIFSILVKYPYLITEVRGIAEIDLILEDYNDMFKVYDNIIVSTIHSFKGKEADFVFLVEKEIEQKKDFFLDYSLLYYTSITRAKKLFYDIPITPFETVTKIKNPFISGLSYYEKEKEGDKSLENLISILKEEYHQLKEKLSKRKKRKKKNEISSFKIEDDTNFI